ncbi:MAG: M48 family metalloprotease [Candidatus Latescibacterota bacterium]
MKITRRTALLDISTLAGAALFGGCAVNPVTGKREFMLMSENQEISLGKESHPQIMAEYGVYPDKSLQEWFYARGQEMGKVTQRSQLAYTFTVLDSPVVNAFAVPGGFVYVTRGILGYFNDEAQFAGVLGHELGHVAARHSASQYSKAQLANLSLGVGAIFSEEFARYANLASVGASLMFLKFSRDDERQADRLGVQYSSAVGYDATRMSDFFSTLERMSPAKGSLPEWASTHPDPGDRIKSTRRMALEYQQARAELKYTARREAYLERINGIVFGDDPRQGYEKNGFFYHPEMKFQFPVPGGWTLTNQPSEVRLTPKDQNAAALIFRLAPGTDPQDSGTKFAAANSITLSDSRAITVNGLKGYSTLGQIVSPEQTVAVNSFFIALDGKVFAFHGLTAPNSFSVFEPEFRKAALGFGRLTDQKLINVSPKKIEVRPVTRAKTLKSAFQERSIPEDNLEKLAVLNGMHLNDELKTGVSIKLVP